MGFGSFHQQYFVDGKYCFPLFFFNKEERISSDDDDESLMILKSFLFILLNKNYR